MASLDDVLSEKPIETVPVPAEQPKPEAAPAAKVEAAKPESKPAPAATGETTAPPADAKDNTGQVPIAALEAERKGRKDWKEKAIRFEGEVAAMQRELAALRQPKPAEAQPQPKPGLPDPLLYPEEHAAAIEQRTRDVMVEHNFRSSLVRAMSTHGKELVDAATEWASQIVRADPAAMERLKNEPDPFGAVIYHYQRQQRLGPILADPDKYEADFRAKIEAQTREKILAEQAEQGIAQPGRTSAAPPPSLATVRSAAGRSSQAFTGPTPLNQILR